jgi:hypothetical protein
VSLFAHFTMAHLCPLGPRVRMNCSKLSALTTRGRFHGVSLDLLLFLKLVYRGPQHRIYIWIWIWIWVESPLMVVESLSPPPMGVVVSPLTVAGLFACGTLCEAGGSLRWALFQSSPSSQTSESVFGAWPTSLWVA